VLSHWLREQTRFRGGSAPLRGGYGRPL
jgi:hypothetical protein